ncbi:hypothetical protein N0V93_003184 [Gnomoniopsis smithogilvyi]|uniref:Uncharacterized protein n=1 Tax=Gnomoniopsis smithogilvyi TaxID=1191159 RepID=A0A9W8YZY5_9PEZI|nr:hypothetical protein N0V93_003184 [Gnomoniopsis smithogilvyi]
MPNLAGSKRPASTPSASPSKAASKRSRTKYDYGDDDDPDSSPEDIWSAEDADSASWDSEDDLLGDFMPKSTAHFMSISSDDDDGDVGDEIGYNVCCCKNLTFPELPSITAQPSPSTSTKCRCGATSVIGIPTSCACSEWGYACRAETCGCHGGLACRNPFNKIDVPSIFGPDPIALHDCFIAWMLELNDVQVEQINTKFLFELAVRNSHLIEDMTEYNEPYLEWRTKWEATPKSEQDIEVELQQEMNRMAFAKNEFSMDVFYSFCRQPGRWESANDTWHCRTCAHCLTWTE